MFYILNKLQINVTVQNRFNKLNFNKAYSDKVFDTVCWTTEFS